MALIYGVNATKRESGLVRDLTGQGEYGGGERIAYDYYTSTGAVIATGTLRLMKLPAGARVTGVLITSEDHGTTGAFTLGWEANGVDAADLDGLAASHDLSAANGAVTQVLAVPGANKKFTVETQITADITAATDASTNKSIWVTVKYVIE